MFEEMYDDDSQDGLEGMERQDGMVDPLERISRCSCGNIPSLYSQNTWKFDYGRMESGGIVKRSFQFCCDGCFCRTPQMDSVSEALSFWNKMREAGFVLKSIREGDGNGL